MWSLQLFEELHTGRGGVMGYEGERGKRGVVYNREGEERGREEDESGVNTRQVHIEQFNDTLKFGVRGEKEREGCEGKRKGRGRRKG